ncbi:uncharacterized protein LOC131604545 [Vicia villosa]|uniref:uncharacterized protein LOC131604545 n=1 Tax=Vicia villosa TaxID=3911 RepID=UPI00273B49E2|nr:uncharacterized protein LOC131604545 [Vicia villosa]
MKTGLLQLLYQNPFMGLDHEDPFTHLTKFYEIAGTIGAPETEEEQVFKRLFPHSLILKAKEWYLDQPNNVMTNWNELEEKFLDRFFPHNRFTEAKTSISVFSQGQIEALNEAWERGDHQTGFYPPLGEEVNYVSNPNQGYDEVIEVEKNFEGDLVENKKEKELVEKENLEIEEKKKKREKEKGKKKETSIPLQNLPYPHAPSKKNDARHYARFMDIFSRFQINIPFSEALEQMTMYAKFIKDIITKKRRFEDLEVVTVNSCCSAIIQRTPPKKESDPGKVTLPVTIGSVYVDKGLIDLGYSINLTPLSLVKRLGNIELKSTRMTLQLANKSTTHLIGIAEDSLVKVDKFFFPVDFAVIDMEEDYDTPLILGRPFMKTARMMIDIDDGLMKVGVLDEEVCFNLFEAMKHKNDKSDCF